MNKKYSVVLPAYNESSNIGRNLKLILGIRRVDEVVVVDDGSSDGTKYVVESISGIKLVVNKKNLGKTRSVQKGVLSTKNQDLIFFDADLWGVRKKDIDNMLDMYESGLDMVIMDKGSQAYLMREVIRCVPALSGVRVLKKEIFEKIKFKGSDRFELEMRINDYFIEKRLKVAVSSAPNVRDERKFKKYSFWKGAYLDVKAVKEVGLMYGLVGFFEMLKKFRVFYRMKN